MSRNRAEILADQALACRKLAWTLGDDRTRLLLHELATEYEALAWKEKGIAEGHSEKPRLGIPPHRPRGRYTRRNFSR